MVFLGLCILRAGFGFVVGGFSWVNLGLSHLFWVCLVGVCRMGCLCLCPVKLCLVVSGSCPCLGRVLLSLSMRFSAGPIIVVAGAFIPVATHTTATTDVQA